MQIQTTQRSLKCLTIRFLLMLCPLLFICLLTIVILNFNVSHSYLLLTTYATRISHRPDTIPYSFHSQLSNLQTKLGVLLEHLHNESSVSRSVAKFSDQVLTIAVCLDKLADSLSGNVPINGSEMSKVDEDLTEPEESEEQEELRGAKFFSSGELYNYTSPKTNRQIGKKNFLGVETINPSIGLPCSHMATHVDRFMSYKAYSMCPDDWDLAQKLVASGCEPLPRRRCFSRTPPSYSRPFPANTSLWTQPTDANILWSHYKCKGYSCLVSNETTARKGFYKCTDCFNLTKVGWKMPTNESVSAEFTIDEVLRLKPGEIRIGLDFSPTSGTFAFFDNTLDIVHSSLFLDGWIGMELLQFVLFDWDRVLRPKGLLWVDRFFCKKEELKLYLNEFIRIGYRKLLWRVVPKTDKLGEEFFFSAVLEKPIRR